MTIEANDAAPLGAASLPEGIALSKGGADAWSPSITPPIGVELTDEQKLACSFRILAREGFSENIAGHITWANADNSAMMVNPWGLWWEEVSASDICRVDRDGNVIG